jgi:hypothetical protein
MRSNMIHRTLWDEIDSASTPLAETLRSLPQKEVVTICMRAGVSLALMRLYVQGASPAGWIQRRISHAIGKPIEELFPRQPSPVSCE